MGRSIQHETIDMYVQISNIGQPFVTKKTVNTMQIWKTICKTPTGGGILDWTEHDQHQ